MATRGTAVDAITLLADDHVEIRELFDDFRELHAAEGNVEAKQQLIDEACRALRIHARVEEEVFYPAVRAALGAREHAFMDEAVAEHACARTLIDLVEAGSASDAMTCALFIELARHVEQHLAEEEGAMFPKARAAELDLKELWQDMQGLKEQLTRHSGVPVVKTAPQVQAVHAPYART